MGRHAELLRSFMDSKSDDDLSNKAPKLKMQCEGIEGWQATEC